MTATNEAARTAPDEKETRRRRLRRAIAGAAPDLARALGGPLAGAAVGAIARAVLGDEKADEAQVEDAIAKASPEQLLALRKADQEFRLGLARAGLDAEKIAAEDRANARAREVSRRDWTPAAMGGLILAGFFGLLGLMATRRLPEGMETEFSIMLGALSAMTGAVVNYYFGSSAGSREKTRLLAPQREAE